MKYLGTQRQHFIVGRANENAREGRDASHWQIAQRGSQRRYRAQSKRGDAQFRSQKESGVVATIDISLPGATGPTGGYSGYSGQPVSLTGYSGYSGYLPLERGSFHPLTQMRERSIEIFRRMGFALADGPDIEDEWHCFDALNTPPDHPARNEQDTFYLPDGRLLRTHTSTVQIRTMESAPPPIRVIAPGAAYRRDELDATHSPQFHQIEGLYVDENVSVADLKGDARILHARTVRFRNRSAISTALLSVHRAKSGGLRAIKSSEARRTMDRGGRLRHGPSGRF